VSARVHASSPTAPDWTVGQASTTCIFGTIGKVNPTRITITDDRRDRVEPAPYPARIPRPLPGSPVDGIS